MSVCTGPPFGRKASVSTTKEHIQGGGHSNAQPLTSLVRWQTAADPVRESPSETIRRRRRSKSSPESLRPPYRMDEVTLESRAGVETASALTDGESRAPSGGLVKLSGRDDRGGGRSGTRAVVPLEGRVR